MTSKKDNFTANKKTESFSDKIKTKIHNWLENKKQVTNHTIITVYLIGVLTGTVLIAAVVI